MDIEYGMQVSDKNDKTLGTVDYIVMDGWSGEPRKFLIRRKAPETDIFFSPEHVAGATGKGIILNVSVEELEQT
jgi:hypothetical protein